MVISSGPYVTYRYAPLDSDRYAQALRLSPIPGSGHVGIIVLEREAGSLPTLDLVIACADAVLSDRSTNHANRPELC